MLSKSQARAFFLTATLGFSGVFLWLTVDSIAQVPERSHQDQMNESVVRGKTIWDENNCMGCHTILGEGAYYAPELTKVVDRRGEAWLKVFLKDPQAMYPGQRKMVQYNFTDAQIEDVIAFLTWIGRIDTNGFPKEPDMRPPAPVAVAAAPSTVSAPAMFTTVCKSCHSLGGQGGVVGPALDGVGTRFTEDQLRAWLANPQEIKPGTTMPDLNLSEADLRDLSGFLMAQK